MKIEKPSDNKARLESLLHKIDELRENYNISYKQLEKNVGFANGYFGKLKKRESYPTIAKVDALAEYFHVTRDYLISTEEPTGSGIKIPLLGRVAAGIPIEACENIIGYEEIPSRLANTGNFFALKIKGDSMSPFICDGDKVIVRQQSEVENNQIAIVLVNGSDATCKEIRKTSTGLMLISKNPSFEPMVFTAEEIINKPIRIIVRVIEIRREL